MQDGLLLCKLVNASLADSIDPRAINMNGDLTTTYSTQMDNLSLMLNAARCRGGNMGNIDINEIINGNKFTILEAIWQIIRIGFFNQINLYHHPEIVGLKKVHESMDDLRELSPSDIILRYVNLHLLNSGLRHFINDFDDDFKDCLLYAHLTYRVAPVNLQMKLTSPKTICEEKCVESRARDIISNLKVLNAECFLTEDDILEGYHRKESACKLHVATMCYLFIYYNGDLPVSLPSHRTKSYGTAGECLEELTCRNFINSFDVYPFSNHLLTNCRNGWILSEMFEMLHPGVTSGMRFILHFDTDRFYAQRVHNNMKIIKLCETMLFDCQNLKAEQLADANKSDLMVIILDMMRLYFCRGRINQKEIVDTINCQIRKRNQKVLVYSLADRVIVDENILALLIDNKVPGIVNRSLLTKDKLRNCKYLISIAHKAGIPIYTLPEHFVDGNATYISIAFATILSY